MLVQEQTIELIINSLQNITQGNNAAAQEIYNNLNESYYKKQPQIKNVLTEDSDKEYNFPLQTSNVNRAISPVVEE